MNQAAALAQNQETKQPMQNVATIRREPDSSALVISFFYPNNNFKKIGKPFTCVRQSHELIQFSMERIKEKILQKMGRKMERKDLTVSHDTIQVELGGANSEHDHWDELLDNLNETESNLVLKIGNDIYKIEYNPPSVQSIELPYEVYAGFDCYPSKLNFIGLTTTTKCTFTWMRKSSTSKEWTPCENGDSYIYRVPENEIGSGLRLTCSVTNKDGVVIAEQTSNVVRISERAPNMEAIERRHKYTPHMLPDHQFRVVTYNLLADFYSDTHYSRRTLFPYCSPSVLAIDFRKALFIRELLGYRCDIMCLQEVDRSIFEHDFCHQFERRHLKGVYAKKGPLPEGLATFYNSNKFRWAVNNSVISFESDKLLIDSICAV